MRTIVPRLLRRCAACIAVLTLMAASASAGDVDVVDLRTEHEVDPMEIGTTTPRLGWRLESTRQNVFQTGYRIIVSSTKEKADALEGDLWDYRGEGRQTQWISYAGRQLRENTRCYWRVQSETNIGKTGWSPTASWNVGLLTEGDWSGQWIGQEHANPWDVETEHSKLSSRYLRTEFSLDKAVRRATMYVCGVGMYEAYVNGNKVGDKVLTPAPTDYRKTLLYNAYDITNLVQGKNAIGVALGCGRFYTMQQNKKPYKITNFGYPKVRLNLVIEFADGSKKTISTSDKWKLTADGPIRSSNEYDGETYDARKELGDWTKAGYDDSKWEAAERTAIPLGTLRPQTMAGMKVVESGKARSVRKLGDKYIVDLGENMAGWLKVRLGKTHEGDTVRIRFAETLTESGELYRENFRHAESTDTYIANGKENGRWWHPTFVYHGFQYAEISGLKSVSKEDIIYEKVSDDMERTGFFSCNDTTLNHVFENAVRGIRANYKGMPVDCPQRDERQPWLGDRTMGSTGEAYVFDNYSLYRKWMRDIKEAQREDGCIPDVAPAFWNYYSDNMTWPAAMPFTLQMLATRYDDPTVFEEYYPQVRLWLQHMKDKYMKDGLITKDKYGDWCVPPEDIKMIHSQDPARKTDGTLIATAYYKIICELMSEFAAEHLYAADAKYFRQEAQAARKAFVDKFLHIGKGTAVVPNHLLYPDSTYFGNNTVTANLLGLSMTDDPYVREQVQKNILANIITLNKDHISCGVIGVQWLMRGLTDMGRTDVAWLLACQKTYPSWGYMASKGATTTWELWNGDTANPKMNSRNHVMLLGDLLAWVFEDIVGIQSTTDGHIVLKPQFAPDEIINIDGRHKSIYGNIVSNWKKENGVLKWHIELPANTDGTVTLPDGSTRTLTSGKHDIEVPMPRRDKAVVNDEFLYDYASFPQCHSVSIVETKEGDLVATYFGGTHERNPDVCIWVSRKAKGGSTWSKPILAADGVFYLGDNDALTAGINDSSTLASAGPVKARLHDKRFSKQDDTNLKRKACWNPVLHQEANGDLALYFKIGLKVADWTGWVVRSKDGGLTWGDREPLKEGFLGPIKNKIVENKGRLIAPTSIETDGWRLYFELSDDGGKTWRKTDYVPADKDIKAIQPTILILPDGRLEALCRTRSRQIGVSFSSDNGETWSKIQLIATPNNNSGIDAVNLAGGGYAMVCNDWPIEPDKTKGSRTPLSLMRSDDGIHWQHWITLEDSPISQYSYPSIIQTSDGHLHIVYTWRRLRAKHVEVIP